MKKLLSHTSTKDELAKYLAEQTIEYAERNGARAVVAYGCDCKGTKRDMLYLKSDREEADTKIVLHALDATANGATEIRIHSPDTDVFILALRRYPDLCQNTVFVTGKGDTYRTIKLQRIVRALGPLKTAALPSFHALTGADNTGSFTKKGKPTCWSVFNEAHDDVIQALSQLGTSDLPSNETLEAVEKLVCQIFLSKTDICSLRALRWWLFTKKQANHNNSPPPPPQTGCVASSGSPCPLSATCMEQRHSTQSSFAVTGGLWLEMGRRQESVDPSDDHTSPST